MLHELAYIGSFSTALNAMMPGAGDATMALSFLPSLIGLCLLGLLIVGGLWLRRLRPHGFRRSSSRDSAPEVAAYDYVTGLPTRRLFETLLDQAVGRAAKTGRPLTVFVVELEHFRMVAESQGQANSNALVRVQAARVKGVLRSMDTVARLTPEQFAVLADNLSSHQEVTAIVEKLQTTVGLPLTLDGHELFLTCRIGIARYPDDATEREGLIAQALQAVKHAKSHGQAVRFSSPESHATAHEPAQAATSFADLLP
ncbi:MAG: GGDEF domain-containing protein [Nitrospirota bacterium]|nr:GGDEF domain-containing protein [Nitrospirota bacterium]